MSFDMRVGVKVEGCDKFAPVGYPEFDDPTYNLTDMFTACMDWDFDREWSDAAFALGKIEHGIEELESRREHYLQYNPPNGWGNIDTALRALKSARECIHESAEYYPISCLYFRW